MGRFEKPTQQRRTLKSQPKLYRFFSMDLRLSGLPIETCVSCENLLSVVEELEVEGKLVMTGRETGVGGCRSHTSSSGRSTRYTDDASWSLRG